MRSMPPLGEERFEAGEPCLEALPRLAPEDQLRIVNVYITQLPEFVPLAEVLELHTTLDPVAALPFRAFSLRQEMQQYDEAKFEEAKQLFADAEKSKNPAAIANAIYTLQQSPSSNGDTDSFDDDAMDRAVKIAEREGMFGLKPYLHNLWGLMHNLRGNYVESIEQYQLSRQGFDANQDYAGIALSLINLSYVYSDFQDTEKSVEFARKSIELLDEHDPKNVSRRLAGLIAVGEHSSKAGRFEEALASFDKATQLAEKENYYVPDEIKVSRIRALYESGESEAAMQEADALEQKMASSGRSHAFREVQVWIAARYAEQGEFEKASRWFAAIKSNMGPNEKSLTQLLDTAGNEAFALRLGSDLLLAASASGDKAASVEIARALDERNKAHTQSSIVNAVAGHELQTKITDMTAQAQRSERELQASRLQLILAGLAAILLAAFAFQFYRTSKTQRQLAETKETFLQEIHHRTKNNLQVLTSVLSLDIRRADRGERSEGARLEAVNRVQMMGLIHDHIYNMSADSGSKILIDEFIDDLLALLDGSLGRDDVDLSWSVTPGTLDAAQATPLGLLICELVTNSFKHAFDEKGGEIDVCARVDDGRVHLRIADTGRGFVLDEALRKKGSLGVQLSFDLAEQAGGQLTVASSPDGTIWTFS